jgi:hypothetical protein
LRFAYRRDCFVEATLSCRIRNDEAGEVEATGFARGVPWPLEGSDGMNRVDWDSCHARRSRRATPENVDPPKP